MYQRYFQTTSLLGHAGTESNQQTTTNPGTHISDSLQVHSIPDRLAGLMVKASASGAEDPGFKSRLRQIISGSSHTSDLNIGSPVDTLSGAWRYRVTAVTGRPAVSLL